MPSFCPRMDGRESWIPLDITREQIKNAKGKPLHLNDELVTLIKAETDAGRPLEVFWDDRASRPIEDPEALSDADWPFDSQLNLAKLREPQNSRHTRCAVRRIHYADHVRADLNILHHGGA